MIEAYERSKKIHILAASSYIPQVFTARMPQMKFMKKIREDC